MDYGGGCRYNRSVVFPEREGGYRLEIQRAPGELAAAQGIFKKLK